jgi:hypothetical protein
LAHGGGQKEIVSLKIYEKQLHDGMSLPVCSAPRGEVLSSLRSADEKNSSRYSLLFASLAFSLDNDT